jgi:hypothetical protein
MTTVISILVAAEAYSVQPRGVIFLKGDITT